MDTDRFLTNLQHQAEDNPVLALGVAAALFTSLSKLLNAAAWKKEVSRRTLKDRKK
jgi:hypothetical protein